LISGGFAITYSFMPDLEPKTIEGTARRRRPLSKPLALAFIVAGIGALVWAYFTRSDSPAHFGFTVLITMGVTFLVGELLRDID